MVDHLLKGTPDGIINRVQIRAIYSVAICRRGSTLGAGGPKLDSNKLRFNVKNEITLIYAKFDADLINISKVTSRKTKWPRFFGPPGIDPQN